MKFMLLIMGDEARMNTSTTVDDTGMSPEYHAFNMAMVKAGVMVDGQRLRPTPSARSVRVRDKKAVVLDGPYAETQEQLGGYYLIEARDLNDALQVAQKIPSVRTGSIEVRPIQEFN